VRISGFTGTLLVTLARSDSVSASACYVAQDALGATGKCPPAAGCSARYDLTGVP
jgi:hypothetical protein